VAYGVAVAGTVIGSALRLCLAPDLADLRTLLLFAPGVLLATYLGGAAPAVAAAGLAFAADLTADALIGRRPSAFDLALFLVPAICLGFVGARLTRDRTLNAIAAARLRDREAHLQSILDTVPDAMVVVDEHGRMTSLSMTAEALFGWTQAEALDRNVSVLMPGPYKQAHDGYMSHYVNTGEKRIIGLGRVVVGQRRDGSTFPMHLSVGEVRVGEARFFTGFVRDLTEREQTQARLQELQSELAHVSRLTAMGEMASALAHELNQPLSAIANYLRGSRRLLQKGDPADIPRLTEALGKAADQAVRAGSVIQRLREFVGRGETEKRLEDLTNLIEEACALALVGARELSVRVTKSYEPGCENALVDRVQIQQVVVNMLRNAMDAMRDSPRRELDLRVASAPDNMIAITISDTGSGIGEATLGRLFEPFMTTKKEGMGVGLSICKTIVESHGGAITAANRPGGGAIFTFTVPALDEASAIV
jgi:two-component system sensor kinase FixL